MILQSDERFDIGSNTGKLNKLTIKIDRPQLSPEDIKKLEEGVKTGATRSKSFRS